MALFSVNLKKRTPAPTVNDTTVIFGAAGGMADETPEPFTVATLWAHLVTKIAGSPFGLSLLSLASAAALRAAIALPNTTVVGRLARYTDATGSQGETAGLFEDASGNVGIGTSAPEAKLDLRGLFQQRIDGSTYWKAEQRDLGYIGFLGNGADYFLNFDTANRRVAVGSCNTQPASKFAVDGNQTIGAGYLGVAAPANGLIVQGNVGIGTTAPQRPLDISVSGTSYGQGGYAGGTAAIFRSTASPASNSRISITSGNVGVSIIDFGDTDGDRGSLHYIHNGDALACSVNGAERMRIDGSGRVGVGTNAPTARLDNAGDTYRQRTTRTPASSSAAGNFGDICWDADFLYICVATNTWKRSTLATW